MLLKNKTRKLSMKCGKETVKGNGTFVTYPVEIW